jgi:CHAT domain-containing protein
LQSGIVLAPEGSRADGVNEVLTSEEIFGLQLRADLVTLSACESGVNHRRPGDELIGLTRALIYAGTPSVVVSLWAVDELSTALLMRYFYKALTGCTGNGEGVTKAHALQAGQLHVMRLSAEEIVRYCDEQIAGTDPDADQEQWLTLQLDRANAQAAAGDLGPAIAAYRHVAGRLGQLGTSQAHRLSPAVRRRLELLEFRAESPPPVDYAAAPFGHPHHWAPFILIGDWT